MLQCCDFSIPYMDLDSSLALWWLLYHIVSLPPLVSLCGKFFFQEPFSAFLNRTVGANIWAKNQTAFVHYITPLFPNIIVFGFEYYYIYFAFYLFDLSQLPRTVLVRTFSVQSVALSQLCGLAYSVYPDIVYLSSYLFKLGSKCI